MHPLYKISLIPLPGLRLKTISVMIFVACCSVHSLRAQLSEDFADGDFTHNPAWQGVTSHFVVNTAAQLQLNSAAAGKSWLQTPFSFTQGEVVEWEFFIKQSFAPSGANYGRFYLMSDQADLTNALNGYYLQFGEAGSNDAIELFRQSGNTSVSLCRATTAAIATSFAIRVKVTRSDQGVWQLLVDYSGGRNFAVESSASDATHIQTQYCGMVCTYTITNATRFFFDDIFIRKIAAPDRTPPRIDTLEVLSSTSLRVSFSEELDRLSAEDVLNYSLSTGSSPASAVLMSGQKVVDLSFSVPFKNGYEETLNIRNVKDLAGNPMEDTVTFLFFNPLPVQFKDIVLTEVLPDPTPPVGLPEAEFVEVINRSENAINVDGWTLSDESTTATLGKHILLPGQYLLLTASANAGKFTSTGKVLPLKPFPSLNNAGDRLVLADSSGKIIDSLAYVRTWYLDEEKADGGWSLEIIDPTNICAIKNNWIASEDDNGGTPGIKNSVHADMPDNTGPKLLSALPLNENVLQLTFDERLDSAAPSAEQIVIVPPLSIYALSFADRDFTILELMLAEQIQGGRYYTVTVEDIYDCPGNAIQHPFNKASFILPELALPGDIIINEILFNPRPTGVDFVEVYNRSEKTIDLKNWTLRNSQSGAGNNFQVISETSTLIAPKAYKVFTEDVDVLKGEYVQGTLENFSQTDMPAFNDDEGSAVIADHNGVVIDSMYYSDKMHVPFLRDDEGVSLERISFSLGPEELPNWRSATSTSGFATPGYVNSNVRQSLFLDEGSVIVEPEIIQPGLVAKDFARIQYRFARGGLVANVKIFDAQGRIIREVADNQLIGPEGFFRWDGDLDDGTLARTGYYMIWFEIFDVSGLRETCQKRVAVY